MAELIRERASRLLAQMDLADRRAHPLEVVDAWSTLARLIATVDREEMGRATWWGWSTIYEALRIYRRNV